MRILFIDHAPALGGAENSLLLLLRHLPPEYTLHLAGADGPLLTRAAAAGVPTHPIALPRLRRSLTVGRDWWRVSHQLARLARSVDAQLLHSNTVRATLYTALAAQIARIPFIWHMRDFWLSEAEPARRWPDTLGKRLLLAAAARVIVNSQAVADHLPVSPNIRVIHNGIDTTQFDPEWDGRSFRQTHAIPAAAPLVGMVGRLRPWKGQRTFLAVAQHVAAALPTVHFVIVGGNPLPGGSDYAQALAADVHRLGLGERITFTGQLDDVRPALAAMDVFVHPGTPEPFGLVNVEAMAMAKPVVAFAHGALPELVVDGETGLLTPPYDRDAMAAQIVALLQQPEYARRLGGNGRSRARAQFDIHRTAAGVAAVYQELLPS